jgi:hypothetical protein
MRSLKRTADEEYARPEVLRSLPFGVGDMGLYDLPSHQVVCVLQAVRYPGSDEDFVHVRLVVAPAMPTGPSRDASRLIEVVPGFEDAAAVVDSSGSYLTTSPTRRNHQIAPGRI